MTETRINTEVTLVTETCISCGTAFAMEAGLMRHARQLGPKCSFYCPNGHPMVYKTSEADTLRGELSVAQGRVTELETAVANAKAQGAWEEKRRIEAERRTARAIKRANAGVCPQCHRTFSQVARHIASKHTPLPPAGAGAALGRAQETA